MRYRPHRRKWGGRDWAAWHGSQRAALSASFYGLDAEVTSIFYALTPGQLDHVLSAYGQRYGASAKTYAVKTYPKWRAGAVVPSAETLRRLLESVPAVLSVSERARLLAILRHRSRRSQVKRLHCTPEEAESVATQELTAMLEVGLRHDTPAHVTGALKWLSCDSMRAADSILRLGEAVEAQRLAAAATIEVRRLRDALDRARALPGASAGRFAHMVATPYATLYLTIGARSRLASLFTPADTRTAVMSNLTPRQPDDLMSELTRQLTDGEKAELRRLAAQNQLSLDAKAREATLSHHASGAEIDRALETAERLQYGEKTSGFNVSGAFRGASGTTNIEVKRAEPGAAMAKWAAIGAAVIGGLWLLGR